MVNDMFVVVSRLIRQLITNTPSSRNFAPHAAKRKWAVGSRFACKISTIDERVYQINIESYGCSMVTIVDVFVGISVLRFYVMIVMFLSKCFRISRWTSTTRLSNTIMSDMTHSFYGVYKSFIIFKQLLSQHIVNPTPNKDMMCEIIIPIIGSSPAAPFFMTFWRVSLSSIPSFFFFYCTCLHDMHYISMPVISSQQRVGSWQPVFARNVRTHQMLQQWRT